MAATAKNNAPVIEVQIVSQMLCRTSVSFAVSNRLERGVARNIPASGAMMNNRTNAPRKRKIRFMEERRGKIIMNYELRITDYGLVRNGSLTMLLLRGRRKSHKMGRHGIFPRLSHFHKEREGSQPGRCGS